MLNPRTYTQIHNPPWYKGRGGGGWMEPLPGVYDCGSILKQFYLYWKAFDRLNKMRYI